MATINQTEKSDYSALKINYTSKDYSNILNDLIESIPGITEKWSTTDNNDPGIVLVKLMSMVGDMLFYNQDMQSLEVYPNSVTQRKNAASIYRLIGYKMRWYQSAIVEANIVNTYSEAATLPRFCTFKTESGTSYTTFSQYELPSNMNNNGNEVNVELIQGIPITPVRSSNSPYPAAGKPWHSIYGYNYTVNDIVNNRIYLKDTDIDQDHIIMIDDSGEEWALKDNIYLTTAVGRFFEFDVDVNDQPYLEIVDYYNNFNISKFKIFYIKSNGEDGQIGANTLKYLTGNVWSRQTVSNDSIVYNVSNFIHFTHYDSTIGYNPETPDEARKNSVLYQNTLDTLITLSDFEKATLREIGVANVRATDVTNDPGKVIKFYVGDINQDGYIDQLDLTLLTNHLADPTQYPLTTYQRQLADINQDGFVNGSDIACLTEYLNPTKWNIGDINKDNSINAADLALLRDLIDNPSTSTLTAFQKRLADINQDGVVNETDYNLLQAYIQGGGTGGFGYLIDPEASGKAGTQEITTTQLLSSFQVKLYILRSEEFEDIDDDTYSSMIITDLKEYKILPLTLLVDLHSIRKCYWTVTGTFFTREPLSRDELQTIIVNINNNLRHQYALDKVNFNSVINYKEVIELILSTDSRILMVDLDPITYSDEEGNPITKDDLTGNYKQVIPLANNPQNGNTYTFQLENTPILPGSVMVRVNGGEYTLRDNNNGQIYNIDSILVRRGTINYLTGDVNLEFTDQLSEELKVDYTKNKTNIATYKNLNTQTFYFDASSLQKDNMQDLV